MLRIALTDVTKTFGDVRALDGLALEVRDGERLAVIGPVGCGKTTLLRIIAGLERPTHGSVSFDDRNVTDVPPWKRGVAMVFQTSALYPHMTVRRNLLAAATDRASSEFDKLVAQLQLGTLLDRRPHELSGGQQRRVAIGRALLRRASILLLDEPLVHLDPPERLDVRRILVEWHRASRSTMVLVTHDRAEAFAWGDRVAVMNGGKLEQLGTPGEVGDRPANAFVASFIADTRC